MQRHESITRRVVTVVVGVSTGISALCFASLSASATNPGEFLDQFSGTADSAWTFRDGYAQQHPDDVANHATTSVGEDQLSISIPGGAEHNQWWLAHAEMRRPYTGSGVYEIKVDSAFTGYQQVGLSFESSPGNFVQYMLYSNGEVYTYVERFSTVNGYVNKQTIAGASTGYAVPQSGPWYLRVTVADAASPADRTWNFQWSVDAVTWTTLTSGVMEGPEAWASAGALTTVGVFAGNQPNGYSAFDARIDYFYAGDQPLNAPLTAPTPSAIAGDSVVDLSWSAVGAATSYRVYRSTGGAPATVVGEVAGTTFQDPAVTNGTTYSYTVTSVNADEESAPSAPVSATPNAVVPAPIPTNGLVLSLDASDLSLAPGSAVESWPDLSGSNHHATSSGSARPTLVANGIGGEPAISFDGTDDYLNLASGFSDFTSGLTIFVVHEAAVLQQGFKLVGLGNGPGSLNVVLGRAGSSNGLQYFTDNSLGGTGWFNTAAGLVTGTPQLVSVAQPGGAQNASVSATISLNGASVGSGNVFVPPVNVRGTNYVGRSFWNEGRYQGKIAEIILYNRTLDAAEAAAVTSYLGGKYFDVAPVQPLAPPTGVSASAGDAQVSLGWNAVSGSTGYRVYRAVGSGSASVLATVTGTSYVDMTAANGTSYTYTVRTLNAAGESTSSTAVTATPVATGPAIPSNGLVLSLDASDLALANGAAVGIWADQSSASHDASASGSARPTLVTSSIGGRPALRFDGVDDHLVLDAGFRDFSAGITMFVVHRTSNLQSGFKVLALGNGPAQQNVVLGRAGNTSGLQYFTDGNSGTGWFNTSAGLSVGQAQLLTVAQPGGTPGASVTATVGVNGASVGSGSVFVPPVTSRGTNFIGRSYWAEGMYQGDIAEIIVYNRALSASETTTVSAYLNAKYLGS